MTKYKCNHLYSKRRKECLPCKEPEDSLATVLVFGLMVIGVVLVGWGILTIAVRAGWV